jgi:membrane protein DedA with SNARE-associated domain
MDVLATLYAYRYLGIFLGTIFEGPVVMAAVGFLMRLGYFEFFLAYILMILGDLTGDIAWYYVGYFGAKKFIEKFGKYFGITEGVFGKVQGLYDRQHTKIIFLSKLTMGFGMAVPILVTAGITKMPIKKFILLNFLGGFIWTAFVMSLGYFFGNIYLLVSEGLRVIFIVTVIIFFLAASYGFSRFWKNEVLKKKI